jgi:hypothetical protein
MGFEPMNTGFADQRVSHFAIGAHCCHLTCQPAMIYFAGTDRSFFDRYQL